VARAGFVLQIDCPDLGMGRHIQLRRPQRRRVPEEGRLHIEALDHALANVPPEQVRMHVCWGNYEGPHHFDVPLGDIIDLVFARAPPRCRSKAPIPARARVARVRDRQGAAGKTIIPGVIDSTTNFIEHPLLVAERITRYAKLVGRESVIAGTDCGFGTWVGQAAVDPDIVWAKLASLAEGARIASKELW
jgi:5-methyltetrahydropteroyltriglutamate--homocysteine methyltransferase